MTTLIVIGVIIIVAIIVGSVVKSRRSVRMGGQDRDLRRHETVAHNPTLLDLNENLGPGIIAPMAGFNHESVKEIVADVAYDSVDHPDGESSDDIDLLAHPHKEEPPAV